MPKLMGVNVLGAVLAALAMFIIGFVWYGVLFQDIWMAARGYSGADLAEPNPAWMAAGFVLELIAAFGIGWLMKRNGVSRLGPAVAFAVPLSLLIAAPMVSYEFVYGLYHSASGWIVDVTHIIATFAAAAAVLSFFDN